MEAVRDGLLWPQTELYLRFVKTFMMERSEKRPWGGPRIQLGAFTSLVGSCLMVDASRPILMSSSIIVSTSFSEKTLERDLSTDNSIIPAEFKFDCTNGFFEAPENERCMNAMLRINYDDVASGCNDMYYAITPYTFCSCAMELAALLTLQNRKHPSRSILLIDFTPGLVTGMARVLNSLLNTNINASYARGAATPVVSILPLAFRDRFKEKDGYPDFMPVSFLDLTGAFRSRLRFAGFIARILRSQQFMGVVMAGPFVEKKYDAHRVLADVTKDFLSLNGSEWHHPIVLSLMTYGSPDVYGRCSFL